MFNFQNFIKSSFGSRFRNVDVEKVWDMIEKYKNNLQKDNQSTQNGQKIGDKRKADDDKNDLSICKKMKQENDSKEEDDVESLELSENYFIKKLSLANIIVENLKSKRSIPLKKLEKLCTKELLKHLELDGDNCSFFVEKIPEKLKKIKNVNVLDDVVTMH